MSAQPLRVLITGGSLCGLFAGIALQRLGHQVRILECTSTPTLPARGAGIVCGADMKAFFENTGVGANLGVVNTRRVHINADGEVVHLEERVQETTSWGVLYSRLRHLFDGQLSITSPTGHAIKTPADRLYRYGCRVVAFAKTEHNDIEVRFTNEQNMEEIVRIDLLIAADGANSTIRHLLLPTVRTQYAGYVAWRGTVAETDVSPTVAQLCRDTLCFFFAKGMEMIVYTIPGEDGTLQNRLLNWVWYSNYEEGSHELNRLMTACDGRRHHVTVPAGRIDNAVWQDKKQVAARTLPPQFAELVQQTISPFVQRIMDVMTPQSTFLDGKVILVGDAVAGLRPHTGSSTNQAAFHISKLEDYLRSKIDLHTLQKETLKYSSGMVRVGKTLGDNSQLGGRSFTTSINSNNTL